MSTYNHNDYNRYKFIGFQLRTEYFNLSSYKTRNFTQTPLLDPNIGSFSERLNLLDGTLEVDPISFKINENKNFINDILDNFTPILYGFLSQMGSRLFLNETPEPIAKFIGVSGSYLISDIDFPLTNSNGNAVPIFCDKYLLILSKSAANTFALTTGILYFDDVDAVYKTGSYNQLNTYTTAQILESIDSRIDPYNSIYPAVYDTIPSLFGSQVQLVSIFSKNTEGLNPSTQNRIAIPVWNGYISSAPRSIDGEAAFEFSAESYWTKFQQKKFPLQSVTTNLEGFDSRRIYLKRYSESNPTRIYPIVACTDHMKANVNGTETNIIFTDKFGAVARVINDNNTPSTATLYPIEIHPTLGGAISFPGDGDSMQFYAGYKNQLLDGFGRYYIAHTNGSYSSSGMIFDWDLFGAETFQIVEQNGRNQDLFIAPLNTYQRYTIPSTSGSGTTCLSRHVFVGDLDKFDASESTYLSRFTPTTRIAENWYKDRTIYFYGGSYDFSRQVPSESGSLQYPLYISSGSVVIRSKEIKSLDLELTAPYQPLTTKAELNSKFSLKSIHWMDIFKHGIIGRFDNPSLWDLSSSYDRIKQATPSRATEIFVDNSNTFGDVLNKFSQLYGVVPTTAPNALHTLKKISQITPNTSASISFGMTDIIGVPQWEFNGDQIVSSVVLNSEIFPGKKLIINNLGISSQYKENGKQIEINLADLGIERTLLSDRNYISYLTQLITSYYFKLFSKPIIKLSFQVPIIYFNEVFPGTVIDLTEFIIPNSNGSSRGLTNKKVLVTGRTLDFNEGIMTIEAIKFGEITAQGYSPCVRISSINTSSYSFTVTSSYLNFSDSTEPTDYAGTNLTEIISSSNAGAGWFNVNDRVQLILRNSTTFATQSFTIASVTANQIFVNQTIPTSSVNWPQQALSGNVDLRFNISSTSGIQANQLKFAYIGTTSSYTHKFF